MEAIAEVRQTLQNLLDVNGADIELVLPDVLQKIDDIGYAVGELENKNRELEEGEDEEEDDDDEYGAAPGSEVCEINSGRDTIYIRADAGNLLDTQIIEALKDAMESDKVKPTFLLEMLQGLTK